MYKLNCLLSCFPFDLVSRFTRLCSFDAAPFLLYALCVTAVYRQGGWGLGNIEMEQKHSEVNIQVLPNPFTLHMQKQGIVPDGYDLLLQDDLYQSKKTGKICITVTSAHTNSMIMLLEPILTMRKTKD